jgi:hypothetical protein
MLDYALNIKAFLHKLPLVKMCRHGKFLALAIMRKHRALRADPLTDERPRRLDPKED